MRPGRLPRSLPGPLLGLLLAVGVVTVSWALLLPPWQVPDENYHFAYVQSLAENFELPTGSGEPQSSEQRLAADRSNADQTAQVLATKPEWSRSAYERWKLDDRALAQDARGDGGGQNPAGGNPPLYYAYASLAYWVSWNGDVFDRLYAMRLWSGLLLLVTTAATWLLVGEVVPGDRRLQLAGAALVGFQPMATFLSASVNPDAMLFALWALVFWLGARALRRGLSPGLAAALFGATGLAVLVKATSYALVPAVLLVLAVALRRAYPARRRAAALAAIAALTLAIPIGGWLVAARALDRPVVNQAAATELGAEGVDLRQFGSYVWQYYLPKLPFQMAFPAASSIPAYDVWLKTGWAAFGWLEVRFPEWVYALLAAASALVAAAAAVAVFKKGRRAPLAVIAFCGLAAVGLIGGLHWVEYGQIVQTGAPFNQGRYVLPLLPIAGLCLAAALTLLAPRWRGVGLAVVLGSLFTLQLFSLGLVAARFYA